MSKSKPVTLSERWFAGKRYVPVLSVTKACKLTYHERLIYSFLVFRRSRDQGATKKKIAGRLGIDRGETVPKALSKLETAEENRPPLVELREGQYWAVKPTGEVADWFAHNGRVEEAWHRQFSTFKVYVPSKDSPLTAKVNGLLWLLYSLARRSGQPYVPDQNHKGLAILMGVSQKFVASALETLQGHGLVKVGTLGFALSQPAAEQLAWWADRPSKKEAGRSQFVLSKVLGWRVKVTDDDPPNIRQAKEDMTAAGKFVDGYAVQMLAAGYPEETIIAYWREVSKTLGTTGKLLEFVWRFEELFREAEAIHRQNGYVRSSIGILRSLSEKVIKTLREDVA